MLMSPTGSTLGCVLSPLLFELYDNKYQRCDDYNIKLGSKGKEVFTDFHCSRPVMAAILMNGTAVATVNQNAITDHIMYRKRQSEIS